MSQGERKKNESGFWQLGLEVTGEESPSICVCSELWGEKDVKITLSLERNDECIPVRTKREQTMQKVRLLII